MTQVHVDPPPVPLIKSKHNNKSGKYLLKLKLCRTLKSATSYLYEFKMDIFDNGEPQEFLLFVWNFNMTLAEEGNLVTGAKVQYLSTPVHGEALCQFDSLFSDMEGTNPLTVETAILGLDS